MFCRKAAEREKIRLEKEEKEKQAREEREKKQKEKDEAKRKKEDLEKRRLEEKEKERLLIEEREEKARSVYLLRCSIILNCDFRQQRAKFFQSFSKKRLSTKIEKIEDEPRWTPFVAHKEQFLCPVIYRQWSESEEDDFEKFLKLLREKGFSCEESKYFHELK